MMKIMGPSSADKSHVLAKLACLKAAPVFANEIFPALWDAGVKYGIDPVGLVAQSYKETGAGKFGGKVTPQFYNTVGIKIRHTGMFPGVTDDDHPLAHQLFPNWEVGAMAQAQHVFAYAGRQITGELIVDPRYVYVVGKFHLTDWAELGGKWAPSTTYGTEIEQLMQKLIM